MNSSSLNVAQKLAKVAPYNILQNTLIYDEFEYEEDENWPSIKFSDIFDPVLGELESSIQFSASLDLEWVLTNYAVTNNQDKPLTIIYEHVDGYASTKEQIAKINGILEKNLNVKVEKPHEIKPNWTGHFA